jgi:hypothetical protein
VKHFQDDPNQPPFIKALAEVRHLATREGWCYQHVQAIIVAIDQYAEGGVGLPFRCWRGHSSFASVFTRFFRATRCFANLGVATNTSRISIAQRDALGARPVPARRGEGRTELRCLTCDDVDPLETVAAKWADSSLAAPAKL